MKSSRYWKIVHLWVVGIFLGLNAAGLWWIAKSVEARPAPLTVEAHGADGVRDHMSPIRLMFSEDIVPADVVGRIVKDPPCELAPNVPGDFRWQTARELLFIPENEFPTATEFVLSLRRGIRSLFGTRLEGEKEFRFRTPLLAVTGASVSRPDRGRRVTLTLEFSQKVVPDEVSERLQLFDQSGENIGFSPEDRAKASVVRFRTERLGGDMVRALIRKGLRGAEGPLPLEEDYEKSFEIPTELVIEGVRGYFSGKSGRIEIHAGQRLDSKEVEDHVTVEPTVNFTVGYDWRGAELVGDFRPGVRYTIKVRSGLKSDDGRVLAKDVSRGVRMPDLDAQVDFTTPGTYIAASGAMRLELEAVNVKRITAKARRIYESNIVHATRMRRSAWRLEQFGDVVSEITVPVAGRKNELVKTALDLHALLGLQSKKGLWLISVNSPDGYVSTESRLVMVSDIGILAKRSGADMLVWAVSLSDASPLAGASIFVYTEKNLRILSGTTDEDGLVRFESTYLDGKREPFVIVAARGGDLSFMEIDRCSLDLTDFDISGRPFLSKGYEAFCFTERGAYRPGETMHTRAIVRGPGGKTQGRFPVIFDIRRPDGRTFAKRKVTLTEHGIADLDVEMPAYLPTGRYGIRVQLPGGAKALGGAQFNLEEFVPDRIRAMATAPEDRLGPGGNASVTVSASHLFGAPAAGREVTGRAEFAPERFSHPDWKRFTFGDSSTDRSTRTEELGRQILDNSGSTAFVVPLPDEKSPCGSYWMSFHASVHEVGGRAVTAHLVRAVDTVPHHLGLALKKEDDEPMRPGRSITLAAAAIRPDGRPANIETVTVALCRVQWNYIRREDGGDRWRWVSEAEEIEEARFEVALENGTGEFAVEPKEWGQYRVRLGGRGASGSASLNLDVWGWDGCALSRMTPDRVEIIPDKKQYRPGEKARLSVRAPFAGRMLFTLERDTVLETRVVFMNGSTCEITVDVREEHIPSLYCTASVIRPVVGSDPKTACRAFGVVSLPLDSSHHRLEVELAAPAEIKPKQKLPVRLTVRDSAGKPVAAAVTLAAVDEGILSLTAFGAPDPFAFFYSKRRLGPRPSDIYGLLVPEPKRAGRDSAPGGGGGGAVAVRRYLNPVAVERVKPVAFWRTGVTGDDGSIRFEIPAAEFNGTLRLMATAVSNDNYGEAGGETLVRGPLLLRPTFPRFLAPGDIAVIPVVVFNLTNTSGTAEVKLAAEGCACVEGETARSIAVPAGGEAVVEFRVKAGAAAGRASLTVRAKIGGLTTESTVTLPVRPAAPTVTHCDSGSVAAGESRTFDLDGKWLEGTLAQKLVCSAMPALDLGGGISYLLRYPYGCVEQTTSCCFPLICLRELAEAVEPGLVGDEIEDFIGAGMMRLYSMQTRSGALSMWPGGTEPYWWGSAYAAHFLAEAGRAGHSVETENFGLLLDSLAKRLDETGAGEDYLSVNAYICYVLSLANRAERSWVERLAEEADGMGAQARYHLAAAAFRIGNHELARKLRGTEIILPKTRATGGCLSSPARDAAVLLDVLLETDPDSPNVPNLARKIIESRRNGRWCSTQENAFALLALGKYAKRFADEKPDFSAVVTGGDDTLKEFTHEEPVTVELREFRSVKLAVKGKGRCFYTLLRRGAPPDNSVEERDSGLVVRRRLLDREGKELDLDKIRRGETVVVEVSIISRRTTVPNVVITDMLPAGLEIENPRIASRDRVGWLADGDLEPDHIDMRDDRMILFADIHEGGLHIYRYVARAVACGEFALPPITAECMYDESIASVHGAGRVRIVK